MPIYIGSQKYNLFLGGNSELLTSDGFILMDLNSVSLNSGHNGEYQIQLLGLNHEVIQDLNEKEDE